MRPSQHGLLRLVSSPAIYGCYNLHVIHRAELRHDVENHLHELGDVQKLYPAVKERLYGDFVRRVECHRIRPSGLPGLSSERQTTEHLSLRLLEGPRRVS